ncbi:hypothetical protein L3X38_013798 [Prunus dulcis]|uniref:Uncharacterized protein n=1 Tax=Prunus dulcis TaxID=3755 RepID=A0AAD4ZHQ1_PRUDU|nr:hypothetical protein L3X38_013798 [Prunus dulcis]
MRGCCRDNNHKTISLRMDIGPLTRVSGSGLFKPPNHEFSDLLQTGKYNYTLWLNCLKTTTKCKCSSFLPHHFQKKKEHTHCSLWLART